MPTLNSHALLIHLFVPLARVDDGSGHRYARALWQACGTLLGMTEPIAVSNLPVELPDDWSGSGLSAAVIAARTRPGAGVYQAVARLEQDVLCIAVMQEPTRREGLNWVELDQRMTVALGEPPASLRRAS